jgi:hypothetical protein
VRWGRTLVSGTAAVVVNPIPDQTNLEPESTVTITASLLGGGTADSWVWRVVSGPAVTIVGTGPSVTIAAPSDMSGASVVIGVKATVGVLQSAEVTTTITSLPQTDWWWSGTDWLPRTTQWS